MKKVLSFVGAALFVAAMTVACGNKAQEPAEDTTATETIENAIEECSQNAVESAAASTEMTEEEHNAMLDAARQAGEAKCNCYKTDAASVESCIKSIIAQSYAKYQDNEEFQAVMNETFNNCVKEKATDAVKQAANEGIKAGANALADKLNSKK